MRRPPFWLVLRAFLLRDTREALSYKGALLLKTISLVLTLVALYYLARFIGTAPTRHMDAYGADYLGFVLFGFILVEFQQVAISSFAKRVRTAQLDGTLEAMLATPARAWQLLLAAPVVDFYSTFLRAAFYLGLAHFFIDIHLHVANLGPALAATVLAMGAFVGLGLFAAAASMFLRKAEPIGWAMSGMSLLAGGVLYPTEVLPLWLRDIGKALPITHALEATRRGLLGGAPLREVMSSLIVLLGFCALLLPLGLFTFAAAVRRARVDGSLTHY